MSVQDTFAFLDLAMPLNAQCVREKGREMMTNLVHLARVDRKRLHMLHKVSHTH